MNVLKINLSIYIYFSALEAVFGSLYHDKVTLEINNVIEILATASLFQLESLISICEEFMKNTVNVKTAICYYKAAKTYVVSNAMQAVEQWLHVNLVYCCAVDHKNQSDFLKSITPGMMEELLSSPNLVVHLNEWYIYFMLRKW